MARLELFRTPNHRNARGRTHKAAGHYCVAIGVGSRLEQVSDCCATWRRACWQASHQGNTRRTAGVPRASGTLARINRTIVSKTILTVDDTTSVLQMVKLTPVGAGYELMQAANGAEGLAMARSSVIDMVITDLNMPVVDGLTLIRELRKLSVLQGVPITFPTTESDAGMKQQAKAVGATGWIAKPFQPAQLIALARKVLGA